MNNADRAELARLTDRVTAHEPLDADEVTLICRLQKHQRIAQNIADIDAP